MGRRDSWVTPLPQWGAVRAAGKPTSHCLHQHGIRILSQRAGGNPWGWAGLGFGSFFQHGVSSSQKHEEEMAQLRSDFELQTKGQGMRQIPQEPDRESCLWFPSSTLSIWGQVLPTSGRFSLPSSGQLPAPVLADLSHPRFWTVLPTSSSWFSSLTLSSLLSSSGCFPLPGSSWSQPTQFWRVFPLLGLPFLPSLFW